MQKVNGADMIFRAILPCFKAVTGNMLDLPPKGED